MKADEPGAPGKLRFGRFAEASGGIALIAFGLVIAGEALPAPTVGQAGAPPAPPLSSAGAPPSVTPAAAPPLLPAENPPRLASYTLSVKLDADAHRLDGKGTIRWRNGAAVAVAELYLHLYLNAFKNERSLYLRSPFSEGRSGAVASDWGYLDVHRLWARELGVDLWASRTPGSPDEPDDETDVRVSLPKPLAPGETLTLDVDFTAKLPSIVERTGHQGDFHFAGQWFPKLAKLEADGRFAHFAFHPQAEFYADFGDYDVTIDVPEGSVLGATGRCVETKTASGRTVSRYQAGPVHDFAWVSWPGFRELSGRAGSVELRVLYPPDAERAARVELETARRGLARFSELYGPYPYSTLTVVHPPEKAASSGGMEYPTLITTGGHELALDLGTRAIEGVTLHELAHQWFYGIVASNEARFPFLDEGLTSYAETSALDAWYGPGSALDAFGLSVSASAVARAFAAERGADLPVASAASAFPGFRALSALVYSRTATLLETLARVYGREKLERALGSYAKNARFGHPAPEELIDSVERELGDAAARALSSALFERGTVDYLVRELKTAPDRQAAGLFDRAGGRETVAPSPPREARHAGRVVVVRHGTLELPVDIDLFDQNGVKTRVRWDGHGSHRVVDWRGTAPLAYAVIDPEQRLLIDDDLTNNAATLEGELPLRVLERLAYFSGLALLWGGP